MEMKLLNFKITLTAKRWNVWKKSMKQRIQNSNEQWIFCNESLGDFDKVLAKLKLRMNERIWRSPSISSTCKRSKVWKTHSIRIRGTQQEEKTLSVFRNNWKLILPQGEKLTFGSKKSRVHKEYFVTYVLTVFWLRSGRLELRFTWWDCD